MELALARTRSRSGAIFLWDAKASGLAVHFHFVDGVVFDLPGVVLRHRDDNRPNGIALWVHDNDQPYLCNDTADDPNYARYFQAARSVVAVPIRYQGRPLGVISCSSKEPQAFSQGDIVQLEELAKTSAKFLRRAQLFWAKGSALRRPFLIKGLAPAWLEVEARLEQVAPTDVPVLIQGESGTGKELLANALHFNSKRATERLVVVNCAAIPEALLESTLFGHVKGAFTGATFSKRGAFRNADGGTLFLDEIGDLPLPLQGKLLRAVEDGEVQTVGSDAPPAHVDVRVICATHKNLREMMREGHFRDDLYYRLSVVTLELPPLRTYKNSLPVMAEVFLLQAARRLGKPAVRTSAAAMALLQTYDFPGNVRELKNIMEHAVIMAPGDEVLPEHLPPLFVQQAPRMKTATSVRTLRQMREEWLAPMERKYLLELLSACGGDVKKAAAKAGVNVVTLYRLLKKRGIALRQSFAVDNG